MLKDKPLHFNEEQIAEWEAKDSHKRKIETATYPSDYNESGTTSFWIVKPTKSLIDAVADTGKEKGVKKANELLLNACIIAGDVHEIEKDGELYVGVLKDITDLFEAKKKI